MPKNRPRPKREAKAKDLLKELQPRYPNLFPKQLKDLKPWAIHEDARLRKAFAAAEGGKKVSSDIWRRTMRLWFKKKAKRRLAYLKCLAKGGPRYNLNGNTVGKVTASQAARAAAKRKQLQDRLTNAQTKKQDAQAAKTGTQPQPADKHKNKKNKDTRLKHKRPQPHDL